MIQREQQVKREHRQSKPKQKQNLELLIHAPPASDHRPGQRAKKQRRIEDEMFAKEFQRLKRAKADVFSQTAARPQMCERDPGMLRVPNDRRNGAQNENSK